MPYLIRSPSPCSARQRRVGAVRRCALVLLASVVVSVAFSGCSGCWKETDPKTRAEARKRLEERKKKEKKKRKPDFTVNRMRPLPYDDRAQSGWIKPGHWVSIQQGMRANHFDFEGQAIWSPVDKKRRRVALDRTGYQMSMSRPLYLAKKQKNKKQVEMMLFAPRAGSRSRFATELKGSRSSSQRDVLEHLAPHQYFFVVLARDSSDYTYLQHLDAVNPAAAEDLGDDLTHYRVLLPLPDRRVLVSSTALTWSSTAHLLWDDIEPNRLSTEQQTAMVDWIHWGGNVLVSGPNSLETLRGSFLADYLPATSGASIELTNDDLQSINRDWNEPFAALRKKPLRAVLPWPAVVLKPIENSRAIRVLATTPDGAPLVVERRVGRGRIVVTAFRLSERDLKNWSGLDGFMNACLLRRGPREFRREGDFETLRIDWRDPASDHPNVVARYDPRRVTQLRFFSRDSGYAYQAPPSTEIDPWDELDESDSIAGPGTSGLGEWNDFNQVSNAARGTIRKAAGIEIPDASFVATVLGAYLAVLIPLNWILFRCVGRIEWAWVAAPVIAIACAGVVIKLAQLDIGFARSNTEVAVVEIHSGYPRAHVTRFNALYTSLSTPYDIHFQDANALVQPFAIDANYIQPPGTSPTQVNYHRDDQVTMTGFHVLSNRTGLVHSEQMIDLGGGLTLESPEDQPARLSNSLKDTIHHATLLRRLDNGSIEFAWLGEVPPGVTTAEPYETIAAKRIVARWREAREQDRTRDATLLDIDPLMATGLQVDDLKPGEVRLVGLLRDATFSGLVVSPSASQKRSVAMVVAHLRYRDLKRPIRDHNCRADAKTNDKQNPQERVKPS